MCRPKEMAEGRHFAWCRAERKLKKHQLCFVLRGSFWEKTSLEAWEAVRDTDPGPGMSTYPRGVVMWTQAVCLQLGVRGKGRTHC